MARQNARPLAYQRALSLGPCFIDILIKDLFYRDLDSDDAIIYSCDSNIDSVIIKLERDLQELLELYTATGMSGN